MVNTINVDIINEETLDAGVTVEAVLHKDGNITASGNISGNNLSGTNTGDETESSIKTKLSITTLSGSNTGDQDLSGLVPNTTTVNGQALSSNVTVTASDVGLGNVQNVDCTTTANISDSTDKRYCTDAQKTVIENTSGTNTGDETESSIKTKLGITTLSGSNTGDQDLSGLQATITGGATTITSDNLTANKVLVSDANGKVAASNVSSTGLQSQIRKILKVRMSANQTLSHAVTTLIAFNTVDTDVYSAFDNTSGNYKFVAPSAGVYFVQAIVSYNTNTSGTRYCRIAVNGTEVAFSDTGAAGYMYCAMSWFLTLTAGDYVQIRGFQGSGGNLAVLSAVPTVFEIYGA